MLKLLLAMSLIMSALETSRGQSKTSQSHQRSANADLLEVGHASRIRTANESPTKVKIVSYNIRWRGGEELHQLAQLFKDDPEIGGAQILGLQEVDRNKKRTGNQNTVKMLAEELGMYYAWAGPPTPKAGDEEETGVAILSAGPLTHINRIVLPHAGPGKRRRVALAATVTMGKSSLRVYSVHSETRISVGKKLEQMQAVIEDLDRSPKNMPAVVVGDFNTWEQDAVDRTSKLFTANNFHTPFDEQATFSRQVLFVSVDLKLDWMWLRNIEHSTYGINRKIELSDHWPLWLVLNLGKASR